MAAPTRAEIAPAVQPGLAIRRNLIPIFPTPINFCLSLIYCPPAHNGNFIDPTLLMNGACSDEPSCEAEATKYYQAIGALDANKLPTQTGTFKGWKAAFGFGPSPTSAATGEVQGTYYNNADLQFGRDMHCRAIPSLGKTIVACYVSNYGDGAHTFGSDAQTSIDRASGNTGRIATVAMVYTLDIPKPRVHFLAQDYRVHSGCSAIRSTATATTAAS